MLDEAHEFVSLGHRRAVARAVERRGAPRGGRAPPSWSPSRRRTGSRAPATASRACSARSQPGWIQALDRHALDSIALLGRTAVEACGEITRDLRRDADLKGDDVELARRERAKAALTAVAEAAQEIGTPSVSSAVYATADGTSTRLRVSPLRVGGALGSRLFGETTVIATSATLTLGGSFRHAAAASSGWSGSAGLAGRSTAPATGPSSTTAATRRRSTRCSTATRTPRRRAGGTSTSAARSTTGGSRSCGSPARCPTRAGWRVSWAREVDALLVELVQAAGGRTLGLFSSTNAAARAAAAVREATDLPVLLQGDDSPGALQHALRLRRAHLPVRHALVLAGRRHPRQRLPARGASTASRSATSTTRCPRRGWPRRPTPGATASSR